MGQSAKSVLALCFIVFTIMAAVALSDGEFHAFPDIGLTLTAVVSFSLLIFAMTRRDKAPDFLHRLVGRYFERDGFTFAIVLRVENSVCRMAILFQNRYSEPCEALVAIKPSREFFMARRPIPQLSIGIKCDGGAFGVVFVPWGIPKQFQGKKQNIDVGASVRFPVGKGQMLRFRDGFPVKGPNLETHQIVMTVAGAAAGQIVLHTPGRLNIRLPHDVAEAVADDSPISILTLWRPGDPVENVVLPT